MNCNICGKKIEQWSNYYPLFRTDYVICTSESGEQRKAADAPWGKHRGHFCKENKWKLSSA